jgi:predicted Zn-dependent peptidase
MDDVRGFFHRWYSPNNAILSISGGITTERALELANKWFGDIPAGKPLDFTIPQEPEQNEARFEKFEADVPVNLIFKVYHMDGRVGSGYYAQNLLSDVLGHGESSRLYQSLKMEQRLFTDVSAFVSGSIDTGMFVVSGKLADGVEYEQADAAIVAELAKLAENPANSVELQRVQNMVETDLAGSYTNTLNKAQGLAMAEMLGDANLVNTEIDQYLQVTEADIEKSASTILNQEKCSTVYYGK